MHAIERARSTSTDFKTHPQSGSTIVFQARRNQRQLVRVSANVPSQHLLVSFKAATGKHHIRGVQVMEQPVALADFEALDGAGLVCQ